RSGTFNVGPCESSSVARVPTWKCCAFERRLCRRNESLGGGFGRGAKPPSEWNVQGVRLARGRRAPPRIWTLLSGLRGISARGRPKMPVLDQQAAILDHLNPGAGEDAGGLVVHDAELEPHDLRSRLQEVGEMGRDVGRP